ncbi:MAG: thioesterase, partial [bacterium]|nr:thioesterase [bacterium]
ATPLGQTVTCRAHVVQREGMAVWFKLEAWDEQECIARAQHRLHIIQVERFARRVNQKRA